MPPARGLGIDAERLDPRGPLIGTEVDPDAVHLDPPAPVADHRPPSSGGDRRDAAAPRDELELAVVEQRLAHLESDASHEPEVLRHPPPRLLHVVDRDVLEEPGDGVQADAPARVQVREPDAPLRGKRPTDGRPRERRVEHP